MLNDAAVQDALWASVTAFGTTLVLSWWLSRSRLARLALDRPNARSLHQTPVPRTGGIGIHAGLLLACAVVAPGLSLWLWAALGLVLAVSLLDDIRGVPVVARLVLHLAAAAVVSAELFSRDFGLPAVAISTLVIAWMANLYNFMDGSDGLAGGMSACGFGFLGAAAWQAGDAALAIVNFNVAAAALAFLVFNFHPARIFMGDVGAVPLGFLAAAIGLVGWRQGDWTWWYPVLVFSPFIVDASVTLLRRLARRERVWQAHRDHYYQRLVQLGWGHRGTALAEYVLMFACGLIALAVLHAAQWIQAATLIAAALAYLVLIAALSAAWRNRALAAGQ